MKRHYKEGNEAYAHAIIRQCPQLGLQSLLPKESERILYTYATLESWIDSITNEDDQEDIRSWARRVGKGTLTEIEFAERVQDLLS